MVEVVLLEQLAPICPAAVVRARAEVSPHEAELRPIVPYEEVVHRDAAILVAVQPCHDQLDSRHIELESKHPLQRDPQIARAQLARAVEVHLLEQSQRGRPRVQPVVQPAKHLVHQCMLLLPPVGGGRASRRHRLDRL